jgi:hypothetical protein
MADADIALRGAFETIFGPTTSQSDASGRDRREP